MALAIDNLRRRPPGPRVLVYLDQSTLSALVTEERFAGAREQLRAAVQSGRLVCPGWMEHTGETIAAAKSWENITRLGRELSMGIDFRAEQEVRQFELYAAARQFFRDEPPDRLWKEAFETDPHTPRDKLFPGGFAVHAYFPPDEDRLAEVENLRQIEVGLKQQYDEARAQGYTFEEQVEREFEAMRNWVLGPLVDGGNMMRLAERRERQLVEEWQRTGGHDFGAGSASSHFMAVAEQVSRVKYLVEAFPELRERAHEFAASEAFRSMPALRYPPIFRAALATMAGRAGKRGDGHDIAHLTRGLSRCDIVTADGGMTQLCINHKLIPTGCTLIRFNDLEGLASAVEESLANAREAPAP